MTPFLERTLVLVKPDAVRRGLVGEILRRFEQAGLAMIGLKMLVPDIAYARGHYPVTDVQLRQMGEKTLATYRELSIDPLPSLGTADSLLIGKMIHEWNAEFLASGPVVGCVLEGVHAISKVRALCGKTMPKDAAPGTIRGDFSSASPAAANLLKSAVYNLVHASDNQNDPQEPRKEIEYWFAGTELVDYTPPAHSAMFKLE